MWKKEIVKVHSTKMQCYHEDDDAADDDEDDDDAADNVIMTIVEKWVWG